MNSLPASLNLPDTADNTYPADCLRDRRRSAGSATAPSPRSTFLRAKAVIDRVVKPANVHAVHESRHGHESRADVLVNSLVSKVQPVRASDPVCPPGPHNVAVAGTLPELNGYRPYSQVVSRLPVFSPCRLLELATAWPSKVQLALNFKCVSTPPTRLNSPVAGHSQSV